MFVLLIFQKCSHNPTALVIFQVDLQEWIEPLNRIDAALSFYIQKYPFLLLVSPMERTISKGALKALKEPLMMH